MAWSYRKRIKIAPGIHINLSKNGVSTSIGPKGASVTMGPKGTYVNTSIPGTGIYSRKKISGNSSNSSYNTSGIMNTSQNDNKVNNKGCRIGCAVLLVPAMLGGILTISSKPFAEMAKDNYMDIWMLLGMAVALFFILKPWFKKKNNDTSDSSVGNSISNLLSSPSVENYGYDYVIAKYNEEEKKAIEKSNAEIDEAKQNLESIFDTNKRQFLQSFIDCVKFDRLSRLYNRYHYNVEKTTDELDPLFEQAARKVVLTQKCGITEFLDWFGYDLSIDRQLLIEEQLEECGIIAKDFESKDLRILVKDNRTVNAIIKKAKGKSLLSKEDKIKINEYLDARKSELIGENVTNKTLESIPANVAESYQNFSKAYKSLTSSKSIWEILSVQANTQAKSSASTLIDRKSVYGQYSNNYKFVQPLKDTKAVYFNFKNTGVEIFIYPEFVVVARANNFDVIPLTQFDLEFKKSNFVEESTVLLPKDAKLVRFTYKYVNRNGERDARYSDNPRYGVYEYGNITFKPIDLTMQFSNSEVAENFVRAFQMLKNGTTTYVDPVFGVTEKFFANSKEVANALTSFYDNLLSNRTILRLVDGALPDEVGKPKEKLRSLFLSDIIKCYESLGHDATDVLTKEGLSLVLVEGHTVSESKVDFNTIQLPNFRNVAESISGLNKSHKEVFLKNKADDFFYLNEVFKSAKQDDLITQYFSLLYRLFSVVAKADGTITDEESAWLEKLMSYSQGTTNYSLEKFEKVAGIKIDVKTTTDKDEHKKADSEENEDPLQKLQSLIGLEEVKKEVTALANFVKIQKEREKKGLKAVGLSYHCVFTGNPGTGKTTVARIVAEIYKSLGLLKKGHLVETDRSGLVAEYVGQTAVKTNKIIDSALDGVLFIDEAYSLVQGGSNDYGNEAISTLLKRMEDDRNRLVVILAGYGNEMKKFIDSNPGLQSRFNRYIHFVDYNVDDLKNIFLLNAKNSQYKLSPEAEEILTETLTYAVDHKDKNFGNGRFVRNLFEKSLQNQAVRLSCQPQTTAEDLSILTINDIPVNE